MVSMSLELNAADDSDKDVFSVLDEDNESFLIKTPVPSLPAERVHRKNINFLPSDESEVTTVQLRGEAKFTRVSATGDSRPAGPQNTPVTNPRVTDRKSTNRNTKSSLANLYKNAMKCCSYKVRKLDLPDIKTLVLKAHPFDEEWDRKRSLLQELRMARDKFALQHAAAEIIQEYWRRFIFRQMFIHLRDLLYKYSGSDSSAVLRPVNPREADLIDCASGTFIRFRLSGETFPPTIVYKIFTSRPIVDLSGWNASSGHKKSAPKSSKVPLATSLTSSLLPNNKTPNRYSRFVIKGEKLEELFNARERKRDDRNDWRPYVGSFAETTQLSDMAKIANRQRGIACAKSIKEIRSRSLRKRKMKLAWMKRLYEDGRERDKDKVQSSCISIDTSLTVQNNIGGTVVRNYDFERGSHLEDILAAGGSVEELHKAMDRWKFDEYFANWGDVAKTDSKYVFDYGTVSRNCDCVLQSVENNGNFLLG